MASFRLEYLEDGAPKEFRFEAAQVAIGRDKGADFVLDHPTVSRQHAVIVHDGRGYTLRVLSRGGLTALDGAQVHGEAPLFDGSVIHFGQLEFSFRAADAAPRPAHAQGFASARTSSEPTPPAPAQTSPWGQQPASQQAAAQPSSSGAWGQQAAARPSSSGAWGQQPAAQAQLQGQAEATRKDNGLVTWDEIAQSAEGTGGFAADGRTDFERIQAAAQKADAKSQTSNPVIVVGGLLLAAAMMTWTFYPQSTPEIADVEVAVNSDERYRWDANDIDCIGQSECEEKARQAYEVGRENLDKKDVDVANLFTGWLQLARVDRYLDKAGVERSAAMANLDARRTAAREELSARFQNLRVKYHNASKRKMYNDMASAIFEIRAYFPDPKAIEHQWSLQREREMRDQGVFPPSYDRR